MEGTNASYNRESTVYPLPEPFALRERLESDQQFLQTLYASSREDLQQAIPDAALLQQLMAMQQNAQEMGFRHQFPQARQWLLLRSGNPIGRAVVDDAPGALHLVDIVVLPAARRCGAATAVLRALQAHAQGHRQALSLNVSHTNPAARRLYDQLGFTATSQDDMLTQMVWHSAPA